MSRPPEDWEPFDEGKTEADDRTPEVQAVPAPVVDVTGRHTTLTPAQFASAVDLADRDAYARGLRHGRAEAQAEVVTERSAVREEVLEVVRSLWVIFELGPGGKPAPIWEETEAWLRRRLSPIDSGR
jgi:hypothetical protein